MLVEKKIFFFFKSKNIEQKKEEINTFKPNQRCLNLLEV